MNYLDLANEWEKLAEKHLAEIIGSENQIKVTAFITASTVYKMCAADLRLMVEIKNDREMG